MVVFHFLQYNYYYKWCYMIVVLHLISVPAKHILTSVGQTKKFNCFSMKRVSNNNLTIIEKHVKMRSNFRTKPR
jgi:hypothetical protein